MTGRTASRLATTALGATAIVAIGGAAFVPFLGDAKPEFEPLVLLIILVVLGFGALGVLVIRRTGNPIGWVMLWIAFVANLSLATQSFLTYSLATRTVPLPGTTLVGWVNAVSFPAVATP